MNNFKDRGFKKGGGFGGNRGPKFGGGHGRDGRSGGFGGDRGGRQSEMFTATCDECHKSCEVPFRPSGDKPVYCSACFGKKNDSPREERGGFRNERNNREEFRRDDSRNVKPHHEHQSERTEVSRAPQDKGLEEIKQKLATIESRLNRILDLINPPKEATKTAAEVVAKEVPLVAKKEVKPKQTAAKAPAAKAVPAKAPVAKKGVLKKVVAKKAAVKVAKKVVAKAAPKVTKKVAKK